MLDTRFLTDLLVMDRSGRPLAAVEARNSRTLTAMAAAQLRRNLLAHGGVAEAPYTLVVSQDVGYAWRNGRAAELDALPERTFSMRPIVERYSGKLEADQRIYGAEFAALVFQWLQSLALATRPDVENGDDPDEADRALADIGLIAAMRGGSVAQQMGR